MVADPAGATTRALEQAYREIARQSQLLATLTAETERVRAEAEDLAQFRSRTLAAIGHELRTPLNAVIGFSEAMQCELHGPLGNPRYRDYAEHIRQSGVQLLQAAESVLDVSRTVAYAADTTPRRGAEASGATLHAPTG